jgi:succinate-semialdehyde dehydrogenase
MTEQSEILNMISTARSVLPSMYEKTQGDVDEITRVIGRVVHDNAELLATMAVEETRMGNVPDKITKCYAKSELIWGDLKHRKTVGIISEDPASGIVEIAEPVGVVAALIPTTNPAVTAMSNAMFAIKGRNTIILSPHPRALKTIQTTVDLMNKVGGEVGLPDNAIQLIKEPSVSATGELMANVDVVLATGGGAMVKAAYSSGKPSFGVGPGNVPVVIHESADIDEAVRCIILGKSYDNGLICASEQAVFASRDQLNTVKESFTKQGAHIVSDTEKDRLRELMWIDGHLNPDVIGKSAVHIAKAAGIDVSDEVKVLLVPERGISKDNIFSKEKLSPVLALYEYSDFEEATERAVAILNNGGLGHTAGLHAHDDDIAKRFAMRMPASRVLVNQSTATNAGGSRENGLVPTTTMGCGSWGNNATTNNVTVDQVINIKRLAFKHAHLRDTSKIFEVHG